MSEVVRCAKLIVSQHGIGSALGCLAAGADRVSVLHRVEEPGQRWLDDMLLDGGREQRSLGESDLRKRMTAGFALAERGENTAESDDSPCRSGAVQEGVRWPEGTSKDEDRRR